MIAISVENRKSKGCKI